MHIANCYETVVRKYTETYMHTSSLSFAINSVGNGLQYGNTQMIHIGIITVGIKSTGNGLRYRNTQKIHTGVTTVIIASAGNGLQYTSAEFHWQLIQLQTCPQLFEPKK